MFKLLQSLGAYVLALAANLGQSGVFLLRSIWRKPQFRRTLPLLIQEIFAVGVLSLPIILVAGLFIGMVVALQGFNILQKFSAEAELGQMIALSVVRELGPVIGALLFAGRAGSSLTAEIGLMKVTEQLSSMEMMGVDPLWRVISPRFWAAVYTLPLLVIIFCAIAIYGGYLVGVQWLGIDNGIFWNGMQAAVDFRMDILNGIIKSLVFAVCVAWIAVYQGYATVPTAAGISRATTRTVVYASLAILGLDFVLTAIMMGGW